jgi:hypothetical protein
VARNSKASSTHIFVKNFILQAVHLRVRNIICSLEARNSRNYYAAVCAEALKAETRKHLFLADNNAKDCVGL